MPAPVDAPTFHGPDGDGPDDTATGETFLTDLAAAIEAFGAPADDPGPRRS